MAKSPETENNKAEPSRRSTPSERQSQQELPAIPPVADQVRRLVGAATGGPNSGATPPDSPSARHRALLTDPRWNTPGNRTIQRAIAMQLQRQYGNAYVGRLLGSDEISRTVSGDSAVQAASIATAGLAGAVTRQPEEADVTAQPQEEPAETGAVTPFRVAARQPVVRLRPAEAGIDLTLLPEGGAIVYRQPTREGQSQNRKPPSRGQELSEGPEAQMMSQEVARAGSEPGVRAEHEPGQPTILVPQEIPERKIEVPAASQLAPPVPAATAQPAPQEPADIGKARTAAIRQALPPDVAILLENQATAPEVPGHAPQGLENTAASRTVPTVAEAVADAQGKPPVEAPPSLSPTPDALRAQIPDRPLTAQELFEEIQSGRTPEQSRAAAVTQLGSLTADAEREKAALLAEVEANRAQLAEQAEAQIGLIQAHVAAQVAEVQANYATLKANLAAHADQQKSSLASQFAELTAQVQSDKESHINDLHRQLDERRNALTTHKEQQKDRLSAIAEQEANRADQELETAANQAIAVGTAEASRHPGESEGAPEQRRAALELARRSANDIRDKKSGIRSKLQEKAREFAGRYDQYVQAANEQITAAGPEVVTKLDEAAQQTQERLESQLTAAQRGIDDRLQAEQGVLDQALQGAIQQLNATGEQVIGQLREAADQATQQLDQTAETLVGYIDNAVVQTEALVDGVDEPYLPGIQDVITSSRGAVQQIGEEGRTQIVTAVGELTTSLANIGQSFLTQVSELSASLQQNGTTALERAKGAIDQTVERSLEQARRVVQQAQEQHQAILDEAMTQVDKAVDRAKEEMNAVTEQFRTEAHGATNDSIREAKKPLTDPLPERVAAAADGANRSWWEGLLEALAEIVVGLLIIVVIAVVVAALTGLTLGGALLVVGAVFLVIAFGAALYSRYQQDPNAGIGTLLLVALSDATGFTGIYEGVKNKDIMTGRFLNLDDAERMRRGTVGFAQLVGTILLAVGGVRIVRTGGFARPTRIGGGRYSLPENVRAVWGELLQIGRGIKGFFERLYRRIGGRRGPTPSGEEGAPGREGETAAWRDGDPLPRSTEAQIEPAKFERYSMDPNNERNGGKWRAFEEVGYDVHNATGRASGAQDVIGQLRNQLPRTPATRGQTSPYGSRFEVRVQIRGPNGKEGTLVTVWQIERGTEIPRLITNWLEVHRVGPPPTSRSEPGSTAEGASGRTTGEESRTVHEAEPEQGRRTVETGARGRIKGYYEDGVPAYEPDVDPRLGNPTDWVRGRRQLRMDRANNRVYQERIFTETPDGQRIVIDLDYTNHGRADHVAPHHHVYVENVPENPRSGWRKLKTPTSRGRPGLPQFDSEGRYLGESQ